MESVYLWVCMCRILIHAYWRVNFDKIKHFATKLSVFLKKNRKNCLDGNKLANPNNGRSSKLPHWLAALRSAQLIFFCIHAHILNKYHILDELVRRRAPFYYYSIDWAGACVFPVKQPLMAYLSRRLVFSTNKRPMASQVMKDGIAIVLPLTDRLSLYHSHSMA